MRSVKTFNFRAPASIPDGWLIFNAPRPLPGQQWEGEYLRGRHYSAVSPADELKDLLLKSIDDLDGWLVIEASEGDFELWIEKEVASHSYKGIVDDVIKESMRSQYLELFWGKEVIV